MAPFSRAVRDVLVTPIMTDRQVEEDPLHASTLARFESFGVLGVGTPKSPCICSSCWHRRGILRTIALWMPVRLSVTTPASLSGRGGPWWDVSRRALNLMEDILSTYYKCTLSAITQKIKCFQTLFDLDIFSCFDMWNLPEICPHLSITLFIVYIMTLPAHSGPRPLIQFRNHFSQTVGHLGRVITARRKAAT
jgi:hypothetical protein